MLKLKFMKTTKFMIAIINNNKNNDNDDNKYNDFISRIFGPRQANLVLIAYASSEGSGEPAHPHSLARTFAARSYKQ